jgi:hypothetical protein
MTWEDNPPDDANEGRVGYRQPPKATRFKKGDSGNRPGRPRGRHRLAPYVAIFSQLVRIREGVVERQVTADRAFLLYLKKEAVKNGGGPAARACMALIEEAKERHPSDESRITAIVKEMVAPGSVTSALEPLRMARKLDPYRETARIVLEPWLVEIALARLDRKLDPAEQRVIVKATRTPQKVRWPEWWSEHP